MNRLVPASEYLPAVAEPDAAPPRRRLSFRRPSELLAMSFDDSDRILGDRVLAKGQMATLVGPGGLGKSRLALQLAAACITGRPWLGMQTFGRGLRWLFLQAENSNRRLHADLNPLRTWAGKADWPLIDECLQLHTLERDDDQLLCLADADTQAAIADAIAEHKPDVVVLDPLNAFGMGDLNTDRDMLATLRAISELCRKGNPQRAVLVLHHALTGKAAAGRAVGFDRASYGRNSKVLQAWTRAQINTAPGAAESNDSIVVSCGKLSNGREFDRFACRLNPDSMLYEPDPDFDWAGWEAETTGTSSTVKLTDKDVAALCKGAMTKRELANAIMDDAGCQKTKAYGLIAKAVKTKRLAVHPVDKTFTAR